MRVGPQSRLHGVEVFELRLPRGANVSLVARDGATFVPQPRTVLAALNEALLYLPSVLVAIVLVLAGIVLAELARDRTNRLADEMDRPIRLPDVDATRNEISALGASPRSTEVPAPVPAEPTEGEAQEAAPAGALDRHGVDERGVTVTERFARRGVRKP